MDEHLIKLYNTMILIETKGSSTKTMADCLRYIEQLISQDQNKEPEMPYVKED